MHARTHAWHKGGWPCAGARSRAPCHPSGSTPPALHHSLAKRAPTTRAPPPCPAAAALRHHTSTSSTSTRPPHSLLLTACARGPPPTRRRARPHPAPFLISQHCPPPASWLHTMALLLARQGRGALSRLARAAVRGCGRGAAPRRGVACPPAPPDPRHHVCVHCRLRGPAHSRQRCDRGRWWVWEALRCGASRPLLLRIPPPAARRLQRGGLLQVSV